jgi:hypothetical protein
LPSASTGLAPAGAGAAGSPVIVIGSKPPDRRGLGARAGPFPG